MNRTMSLFKNIKFNSLNRRKVIKPKNVKQTESKGEKDLIEKMYDDMNTRIKYGFIIGVFVGMAMKSK